MADIDILTRFPRSYSCDVPLRVGRDRVGTLHLDGEQLRQALFKDSADRILIGGERRGQSASERAAEKERRRRQTPLDGARQLSDDERAELTRANVDAIAAVVYAFEQVKDSAAADIWLGHLLTDTFLALSSDPVGTLTRAVKRLGLPAMQLPSSPELVEKAIRDKNLDGLRTLREAFVRKVPLPKGRPRIVDQPSEIEDRRRRKRQIVLNVRKVRTKYRRKHGRNVNTWPHDLYQKDMRTEVVASALMGLPLDKKDAATRKVASPALKPAEVAVQLLEIMMQGSKTSRTRIRQSTRKTRR